MSSSGQQVPPFEYSREWYEQYYHGKAYGLPERDYTDVFCRDWDGRPHKQRLRAVFSQVSMDGVRDCLEVACHHGKTMFWLCEWYPHIQYWGFDFSQVAIDWCRQYNPFPDRCFFTRAEVGEAHRLYERRFDLVTCIDVTEHLPPQLVPVLVEDCAQVLKETGMLVLMQGVADLPEHINVMTEAELLSIFRERFAAARELPHRHYLLRPKADAPQRTDTAENGA